MYIFLDESGNFTKHNHEEYFVVGSFTIGDQRKTDKDFRKFVSTKFPRKMRTQSEVKWSVKIDDRLRLATIKYISKMNVRIRFGFLLRSNIPSKYKNKKNKIEDGVLYTNIVGEILEKYLPIDEKEIHVFCDQRSLKGMKKRDFQTAIKARLLPYCSPDTLIQVEMIDSTSNANIQIADWISGALSRYLEKTSLGEECYLILKNNLLAEGQEFFPR